VSWYLEVLKKYVQFSGRARRKEYWMFTLVHVLIMCALYVADGRVGTPGTFGLVLLGYSLLLLLPSLAVTVRRLHDTGRSGWWLLLYFLPLVGPIALLVFAVQDSEGGSNDYGPNPKGAMA
jgi:uncharacterized membrane protein YhaH (DUF805 family)